jgi:hypothetical protein
MITFPIYLPRWFTFLGTLCLGGLSAADTVDYFADNGYSNPISTFQHPAGEHFEGVTYVAYQGPHEDAYVAAYVHATGQWSGPFLAGVSPMGISPDQIDKSKVDNHGKPALIVDRKGYIHLVFGSHGGDPKYGPNPLGAPGWGMKGKMTHLVSTQPGDISAWRVVDNVSPHSTYNQWVKLDNGDLYLFYRHGGHRSDWVYQKSTDDGLTFSAPASVLKHKISAESPTVHDSWYAWFHNGHGNTITASYVYHPCAHPRHHAHRQDTYYMQMDTRTGQWTNVQGTPLTLPVTKETADQLTLVEATGDVRAKRGTTHVDSAGRPHLVFNVGRELRYYRWDGSAWQKPVAIRDGSVRPGDGDFIVDSPTHVRMLLSQSTGNRSEIGWWNTTDGGLTWLKGAVAISSEERSFSPSAIMRNAHPDAVMLVASSNAADKHPYHRMHLVGARGPLVRPAAETSHLGDRLEQIKLLPPIDEAKAEAKAEAKRKNKLGIWDDDDL